MTGCVVHVVGTALGLSVILSTSVLAFTLVKWAGAAYLIYLGIKTLTEQSQAFERTDGKYSAKDLFYIYRQGIITNVLNPKVALFFLSFLPQFINPSQATGPLPFLLLGATFLVTGTTWFLILAGMAALMTRTLRENRRISIILQKLSGMIFIGFGLKLAFSSK